MNLRKLFALLMTAVMLLGMIPVGHAEGGNMMPGGEFTVSCNHNWAWRFPNGEPKHCQEERLMEMYCTLCGQVASSYPVTGDHTPGSWHWDGNPPANCNEWGIQNQSCSVCGEVFNEREVRGDHQWGGWSTVSAGNCQTPAKEQRSCSVCGATESRNGDKGDHQFSSWRHYSDPTCIEKGWDYKQCHICGVEDWKSIDPVDHVFGEWYVVAEPQVGVPGLEQRDCTYGCGTNEQREIPALEAESTAGLDLTLVLSSTPANGTHFVVGEEVIFTETWSNGTDKTLYPFSVSIWTCDVPSYGSMVDQICSWFAEDGGGPVAPGASGSHTLTVTVTEADVARGAIYAVAELLSTVQDGPDLENVTTPFVTAPCAPAAAPVVLEKIDMRAPANGAYYVPGEVIQYGLTVRSTEDNPLKNIVIYDPLKGGDQVVFGPADAFVLGAGFEYTVTEADAQRGYVENTAYATFIYASDENGKSNRITSNTLVLPCGFDDSGDFGLSAALSVTKAATNTPDNGSYYEPGEVIFFEITATNTSAETLTNLTFHDPLITDAPGATVPTFAPGETASFQAFYVVTDVDAFAGSVTNVAYMTAADADGHQVVEYSNTVTVPCGFPEGSDIPFGTFADLAITKQEESLPLNGSYYTLGEEIHYRITYTNAGELTMLDVEIFDLLDGVQAIASAEKLEPGESRTCNYIHAVTDADVAAGYVCNAATGTYMASDYAGSATSNSVVSDTSEKENHWGESLPSWGTIGPDYIIPALPPSPGFPTLPSWTPDGGFVSIPKVPIGEVVLPGYTGYPFTPSDGTVTDPSGTDAGELQPGTTMDPSMFGTIDTETLHTGTTSCMFTITGRDQVSASYETSFCPEHADTQSSVLMMKQMGATPEMEMQAAAYAVALWRTEVESLYQTLLNAADPTAKAILLTEYVRFLADLANYELMLKELYPDQPALVARKVADVWQDKCATLCYEMHTVAAERTDSLLNVAATAGGAAEACTCVTSAEENGKQLYTQTYCPTHGFPFAMIDMLLKGENTAEAWTMVRQIWSVELTSAYNKLSARLGESSGIATAEHAALMQWMIAREASLIALYPNNPEVVAQAMVKTIMDRVNDLCQVSR
ncbi:MAG: hypothetical protein J6M20_04595 [Clostridia bacterium]|nr:hypothetical protein [Clostridia bacterium]